MPTTATLLQWLGQQYILWKIEGFRAGRKRRARRSTAESTNQGVKKCLERLGNNNQLAPLKALLDVEEMQKIAETIVQKHSPGHAAGQVCFCLAAEVLLTNEKQ